MRKLKNDLLIGFTLGLPIEIYALINIKRIESWHYIVVGFILLIAGTLYSIHKDIISKYFELIKKNNRAITKRDNRKKSSSLFTFIFFILLGVVVIMVLLPGLGHRHHPHYKMSCTNNLKQIGLSLRMYSNVYDEDFPHLDGAEGLELLRKNGFLENMRVYKCPSVVYDDDNTLSVLTEDKVGFCFRGGLTEAASVDSALAWDKPNNHDKYGTWLADSLNQPLHLV